MTLREAWREIKRMEGADGFAPRQVYAILSDLGVFKENPRCRLVVKSALEYELFSLANDDTSSSLAESIRLRLENDGYAIPIIDEVINSIGRNIRIEGGSCQSSDEAAKSSSGQNENLSPCSSPVEEEEGFAFLGIPFGINILEFCKRLARKGFSIPANVNRDSTEVFFIKGIFSSCVSDVRVYATSVTHRVYKCIVYPTGKSIYYWTESYKDRFGAPFYSEDNGRDKLFKYKVGQGEISISLSVNGESIEYIHNGIEGYYNHESFGKNREREVARRYMESDNNGGGITFLGIPFGLDIVTFYKRLIRKGFSEPEIIDSTIVCFPDCNFGGFNSRIKICSDFLTHKVDKCIVYPSRRSYYDWIDIFNRNYGMPFHSEDYSDRKFKKYQVGMGMITVGWTSNGGVSIEYGIK